MKYYCKSKKRLLILLIILNIVNSLTLTSCNSNIKDENSKTEQYGNLMGNIINKGLVSKNEQWICAQFNAGLYKMNTNCTDIEKIIDGVMLDINVWDGYIYYCNGYSGNWEIYKTRLDGYDNIKLNNEPSYCIIIKDGWIYYSTVKDISEGTQFKIKKMKIDGTNQMDIVSQTSMNTKKDAVKNPSRHFFLYDGWIYYLNILDMNKLYRIQDDGKNNTKVSDEVFTNEYSDGKFIVEQNWIYYIQENGSCKLYRMKLNGTEKEIVINKSVGDINITNHYIYYTNCYDDFKLYRRNKDSGEEIQLTDHGVSDINVIGDWIYCRDAYTELKFYMISCDGDTSKEIEIPKMSMER